MGASNSRFEEDKALQLCRARKKFIKQALSGRCSLAAAQIVYTGIGAALSSFVEPDAPVEASKPHFLAEKIVDVAGNTSSSLSHLELNAMKYGGVISAKVEEKPSVPVMVSAPEVPSLDEIPPWDYFSLFHPMEFDHHDYDRLDEARCDRLSQEDGMPELEDAEGCDQVSEDEFDEPSSASLVRSFTNVTSGTKCSSSDKVKEAEDYVTNGKSPIKSSVEHVMPKTKSVEWKNKAESPRLLHLKDAVEDTFLPKDFFLSINDIQQLFVQASESGKEVPRMLIANTFHFRPVDEHQSEVRQEVSQDSVKYVTWHWMRSSHSSSSQNPLLTSSTDDVNDPRKTLFDNSCMVSGSHTSSLDQIYAWEEKLYDEVKAAQVLKTNFDRKCKLLRQKEARGMSTDKTRAVVRDLHSRIRVAIHRINSISKKIEEIRDMELQPHLEELVEGLKKMWETMAWCHRLQLRVISISSIPEMVRIKHGQMTALHLSNELNLLPSIFTKWISAQKAYVESIDKWLFKCIVVTENPTKRNRRMRPPPLRNWGPPIYVICGVWLEMIGNLSVEGVLDSVKALADEVAQFMPRRHNAPVDHQIPPAVDRFRTTLANFFGQLSSFAESCVKMFGELQNVIEGAKSNYEQFKSKQQRAGDLV